MIGDVRLVLIAAAGALGALARYGIGVAVGHRSFPWSTLAINIAGCFVLGVVVPTARTNEWSRDTTLAVTVGFLGAFTAFSTFGFEPQSLLRDGRAGAAAAYVVASVVLGVAAAAAG